MTEVFANPAVIIILRYIYQFRSHTINLHRVLCQLYLNKNKKQTTKMVFLTADSCGVLKMGVDC